MKFFRPKISFWSAGIGNHHIVSSFNTVFLQSQGLIVLLANCQENLTNCWRLLEIIRHPFWRRQQIYPYENNYEFSLAYLQLLSIHAKIKRELLNLLRGGDYCSQPGGGPPSLENWISFTPSLILYLIYHNWIYTLHITLDDDSSNILVKLHTSKDICKLNNKKLTCWKLLCTKKIIMSKSSEQLWLRYSVHLSLLKSMLGWDYVHTIMSIQICAYFWESCNILIESNGRFFCAQWRICQRHINLRPCKGLAYNCLQFTCTLSVTV